MKECVMVHRSLREAAGQEVMTLLNLAVLAEVSLVLAEEVGPAGVCLVEVVYRTATDLVEVVDRCSRIGLKVLHRVMALWNRAVLVEVGEVVGRLGRIDLKVLEHLVMAQ